MNTINHTCRVCDAVIENAGMGTACARCGVRVNAEFWTVRESKPSSVFLLVVGLGLFAIAAREVSFGQWEAHQILILGVCVLVTWMFIANRPNEAVIWKSGVVLLERGAEPRRISWKGVTDVKFNDELDRIEFEYEPATTPEDREFHGFMMAAGTVAGQQCSWRGMVGDHTVIQLEVVWNAGEGLEPEWPMQHGYLMEVTGQPNIRTRMQFSPSPEQIASGRLVDMAQPVTAMPCVNAIPAVCEAAPGIRTFADLPLITARYVPPAAR